MKLNEIAPPFIERVPTFPYWKDVLNSDGNFIYSELYSILETLKQEEGTRRRRFTDLEDRLLEEDTFPYMLLKYALYLDTRWIEAESRIALDASVALEYAYYVIKGRFKIAEKTILRSSSWKEYILQIIFDKQIEAPEIEQFLAKKDVSMLVQYCLKIKKRLPQYEDIIVKTKLHTAYSYCINLIKEPWPELEERILSEPIPSVPSQAYDWFEVVGLYNYMVKKEYWPEVIEKVESHYGPNSDKPYAVSGHFSRMQSLKYKN